MADERKLNGSPSINKDYYYYYYYYYYYRINHFKEYEWLLLDVERYSLTVCELQCQ